MAGLFLSMYNQYTVAPGCILKDRHVEGKLTVCIESRRGAGPWPYVPEAHMAAVTTAPYLAYKAELYLQATYDEGYNPNISSKHTMIHRQAGT